MCRPAESASCRRIFQVGTILLAYVRVCRENRGPFSETCQRLKRESVCKDRGWRSLPHHQLRRPNRYNTEVQSMRSAESRRASCLWTALHVSFWSDLLRALSRWSIGKSGKKYPSDVQNALHPVRLYLILIKMHWMRVRAYDCFVIFFDYLILTAMNSLSVLLMS